jgi:hypothetical protein
VKPEFTNASKSFREANPHIFATTLADFAPPEESGPTKQDLKLEKDLQNQLYGFLTRMDVVVIHARTDKKSTIAKDLPDLMFVLSGKPVALECKRPDEKPTTEQLRMHERMRKNGWTVEVVDDYDRAVEKIRKIFLNIYL